MTGITITVQEVRLQMDTKSLGLKLDTILNFLKDHIVDKQQFADALDAVGAALTGVGEQLTKATAEIVAAVANAGASSPAMDAALAKLQLVAANLEQASQGLDDLNPDAPPAP